MNTIKMLYEGFKSKANTKKKSLTSRLGFKARLHNISISILPGNRLDFEEKRHRQQEWNHHYQYHYET